MERMLMDCCVGCRNYQRCMVCKFENDVVCEMYKLQWLLHRIGRFFRRR